MNVVRVLVFDLNGDCFKDVIVVCDMGGSVSVVPVWSMSGTSFVAQPSVAVPLHNRPVEVAIGCFQPGLKLCNAVFIDATGLVVTASVSTPAWAFSGEVFSSGIASAVALDVIDMDGDGVADLIVIGDRAMIWFGPLSAGISSAESFALSNIPYVAAAYYDMNDDGVLDVVTVDAAGGMSVLLLIRGVTGIGSVNVQPLAFKAPSPLASFLIGVFVSAPDSDAILVSAAGSVMMVRASSLLGSADAALGRVFPVSVHAAALGFFGATLGNGIVAVSATEAAIVVLNSDGQLVAIRDSADVAAHDVFDGVVVADGNGDGGMDVLVYSATEVIWYGRVLSWF